MLAMDGAPASAGRLPIVQKRTSVAKCLIEEKSASARIVAAGSRFQCQRAENNSVILSSTGPLTPLERKSPPMRLARMLAGPAALFAPSLFASTDPTYTALRASKPDGRTIAVND